MKNFLLLFLFLCILSGSCKKENRYDCLKGTGNITCREEALSEFKVLQIEDLFQVYITSDTLNKIHLEGGENLLPLISYEVHGDTLVLQNNNKCNWVRSYKKKLYAYFNVKSLQEIVVNGESDIFTAGVWRGNEMFVNVWAGIASTDLAIDCDKFHLNVHAGTGNYTLKGKAGVSYIYSMGNSYVFANSLASYFTYITNSSTGDCFVNATNEIGAKISSSGNIYYTGNPPKLELDHPSGDGELINAGAQ